MAISSNGDKYFSNVSLLLPFDGANGSTTFYDASPVPKAVTTVGNTNISTTQSKFGGSSGYFDGTGDYITVPSSTNFNLSGDFTIEGWIKTTDTNFALVDYYGTAVAGAWQVFVSPAGYLQWWANDGASAVNVCTATSGQVNTDAWVHIAVSRSGTTVYLFSNGTLVGQATDSRTYTQSTITQLAVGAQVYTRNATYDYQGYIDSLRITKGLARYTVSFTPPTAPFPTDWEDVADPYYDNVVLHLPMDGAENGTTFVDRSKTPKTITTVGNTKLLAAQSKFGGRSCYFDGSGDYLSIPNSSDFSFGTEAFTVEFWVNLNNTSGTQNFWGLTPTNITGIQLIYNWPSAGNLTYSRNNAQSIVSTPNFVANTWYHIALVKATNTMTLFIDGTSVGSISDTLDHTYNTTMGIGTEVGGDTALCIKGYIDSFRITKGVARYTSNFTAPTGPFAIGKPYVADPYASNVKLLLTGSGAHLSNAVRDESGNNIVIGPVTSWIARDISKVNGGSFYFSNGQYLLAYISNFYAADFTIDFWAKYVTAPTGVDPTAFFGKSQNNGVDGLNTSFYLEHSGTSLNFKYTTNGTTLITGPSATLARDTNWHHIAIVRNNGNITIFVDGVAGNSYSIGTTSFYATTLPLAIGLSGTNSSIKFYQGVLNNFRITMDVARYTANFTPEYSYLLPPVAITSGDAFYDNTVLTLRLDGNYVDSSPKNNTVTAYGNASLSASTYKYGTGSLSLDGVGDYIATLDNVDFRFGTGDFCIECWVNVTTHKAINAIFDHVTGSSTGWMLYIGSAGNVFFTDSVTTLSSSVTITAATWTHVAVTRNSGNITIWISGVQACTPTATGSNFTGATTYFGIGALINNRLSLGDFQGYIDNVRITKGAARYTTTFTPADIEGASVSGPVRAYSVQSITSNGAVKFTIPVAGVIQAGFSTNASTDITKNDLEYSIQIDSSKVLTIVEAGVVKATKGTASDGTNFEIEYSGTTMTYKSNGAQLLTTTVTAGMTLYFSAFIEDTGLYVTGIQIGTYASDGTPGNISGQITADNISTYISSVAIGEAYIANAAITTAKINDLAVTTGKINDLAVETLKIAGNSISKVYAASGGTITINSLSAINDPLAELTNIAVPGNSTAVVIIFNATYINNQASNRGYANFELRRDNAYIFDIVGYNSTIFSIDTTAGDTVTVCKVFVDTAVTAGTHSYQIKPSAATAWTLNASGNLRLTDITLYAVPLLR